MLHRSLARVALPTLLLALPGLSSCGDDKATAAPDPAPAVTVDPLAPPSPEEGFQFAMDVVAPPFTEVWKCKIEKLAIEKTSHINRVVSRQTEAIHHMDVMTLAFTGVNIEPGEYDCKGLYDRYPELMEKGVTLFAAQIASQDINLPTGTVATLLPSLVMMHEIHYVNTTEKEVKAYSRINAYTIPGNEVKASIWGGAVRDRHINVPPRSAHEEWTRCTMTDDIDMLFLSSHTHELGKKVTIARFDGQTTGEVIYENTDWQSPKLQDYSGAPLHIKKGEGFEFRCYFQNPRDEEVHWGFRAADEMCQIAIVHTPGDSKIECKVVDSSDGMHAAPPPPG